ncbi:hypothetical protein SERLA73DRAFT_143612, partial [Serpula lacrymans var. lacrymans S7.3]
MESFRLCAFFLCPLAPQALSSNGVHFYNPSLPHRPIFYLLAQQYEASGKNKL